MSLRCQSYFKISIRLIFKDDFFWPNYLKTKFKFWQEYNETFFLIFRDIICTNPMTITKMRSPLTKMAAARYWALGNTTRLRKAKTLLKISMQFVALQNTRKCRLAKENTTSHITTAFTDSKIRCSLLLEEALPSQPNKVNGRSLTQMSLPWKRGRRRAP